MAVMALKVAHASITVIVGLGRGTHTLNTAHGGIPLVRLRPVGIDTDEQEILG
jgi:hypothetical protein